MFALMPFSSYPYYISPLVDRVRDESGLPDQVYYDDTWERCITLINIPGTGFVRAV